MWSHASILAVFLLFLLQPAALVQQWPLWKPCRCLHKQAFITVSRAKPAIFKCRLSTNPVCVCCDHQTVVIARAQQMWGCAARTIITCTRAKPAVTAGSPERTWSQSHCQASHLLQLKRSHILTVVVGKTSPSFLLQMYMLQSASSKCFS